MGRGGGVYATKGMAWKEGIGKGVGMALQARGLHARCIGGYSLHVGSWWADVRGPVKHRGARQIAIVQSLVPDGGLSIVEGLVSSGPGGGEGDDV